jgi:hypothetical protein
MSSEELLTELNAALDVVDAAKRWQRNFEKRRQDGLPVTPTELWLSETLDAYQQRRTRHDISVDGLPLASKQR